MADKRLVWKAVLALFLLAIVGTAAYQISQSIGEEHRGLAVREIAKLPVGEKIPGRLVVVNYKEYRGNATLWSVAYFGCLFGSAFASALAGVVLKLDVLKDSARKNDAAAALAAIAALLVTLSTSGDFQRKWQANRVAADAMENLSYDLLRVTKPVDRYVILDRIKEINEARSEGVTGKRGGETKERQESGQPK